MSGDDGNQELSLISENVSNARFGSVISKIGDFNGDGLDDFAVGAPDINKVTVFFGSKSEVHSEIDISALTSQTGFSIVGPNESDFGESIGFIGDFNNDGMDDFIIGAPDYKTGPETSDTVGAGIVILGHQQPSSTNLSLDALGSKKFILHGNRFLDKCGSGVAGNGDLNDDGFLDLVIGCENASKDEHSSRTGLVYVYLGHRGPFPEKFDLGTLDGINGFRFIGASFSDNAGASVTYIGDINKDSIVDLHIGTHPGFVSGGAPKEGLSYVYYGNKGPFSQSISLETITHQSAYKMNGEIIQDSAGSVASPLGDFNKDGIDDFIVGSRVMYLVHENHPGRAYVIYGEEEKRIEDLALTSLDGKEGFIIDGETERSSLGYSVAGDFDYDNDGNKDFIVSAHFYSDILKGTSLGRSYLVYGPQTSLPQFIDLPNTSGLDITSITGFQAFQYAGESVAHIGDYNGDGYADIAIGMPGTKSSSGKVRAGAVLLSLGHARKTLLTSSINAPQITNSAIEPTIADTLTISMSSAIEPTITDSLAISMSSAIEPTITDSLAISMSSASTPHANSMFTGITPITSQILPKQTPDSMSIQASSDLVVSAGIKNQNVNLNLFLLMFTLTSLINFARHLVSGNDNARLNQKKTKHYYAKNSQSLFHHKHIAHRKHQQFIGDNKRINSEMRPTL